MTEMGTSAVSGLSGKAAAAKLTQRQKDILAMLEAGKANKEIASALGIGIGTVKQHVVALFKKLKVRNRTMAVTQGMSLLRTRQAEGHGLKSDSGLLQRRPCVVLSVALPADAAPATIARLHGVLAAQGSGHDAVFLARRGNAGDVILGIQRATEYDLVKAMQILRAVRQEFRSGGDELSLRAGLAAGIAVASMGRFGGWTGEAMASGAISAARSLADQAAPGCIRFGAGARELMASCGMGPPVESEGDLGLACLDEFVWTGERRRFNMVGREQELASLRLALRNAERGAGRVVYLEGETGMGKSRLCRRLVDSCSGPAVLLCCLPGEHGGRLRNAATGQVSDFAELDSLLPQRKPRLVVVDDLHFLAAQYWEDALACARQLATDGVLVVLAGRRSGEKLGEGIARIRLGRLDDAATARLVAAALKLQGRPTDAETVRTVVAAASGVPFFATELAVHGGMTLPVFAIVCARLDGLGLDHRLLIALAKGNGNNVESLSSLWGEPAGDLQRSAERALAAGVLRSTPNGKLSFSHPLLRLALEFMGAEGA